MKLVGPKTPAIFPSTCSEHGKKTTRTAIHWPKIIAADILEGTKSIVDAWKATKDALGGTTYDAVATATGLEVGMIASHLKWLHQQDPNSMTFVVDRMGHNIGFKLKGALAKM